MPYEFLIWKTETIHMSPSSLLSTSVLSIKTNHFHHKLYMYYKNILYFKVIYNQTERRKLKTWWYHNIWSYIHTNFTVLPLTAIHEIKWRCWDWNIFTYFVLCITVWVFLSYPYELFIWNIIYLSLDNNCLMNEFMFWVV